MLGIFPWNYSFLLQEQVKYFKDDNPKEVMITLIGIGVIVVFYFVFHLIKNGTGGGSSIGGNKSRGSAVTPRKFNAFTLFRISSAYGLSRDQTKLLEFVFRNDGVNDPERVMKSPSILDRHFKKAYKTIEKNSASDEEAQQRMARLFSLRNALEASPIAAGENTSPQLAENSSVILLYGSDSYPVKVLYSRGMNAITDIPRNALGTPLRIANGAKITLSYFTKANKGFSLDGHVVGSGNTARGAGLKIAHSGKMKPLVKRQFRRKQIVIKCEFSTIHLEETGKKKTNKLVVDAKKFSGAIQDISIGGCAIKTNAAIQAGTKLKLNLDYSRNYMISVLGQVLRINRSGFTGAIMHVKFLKVPLRAFNSVNSLVYGYDEDKP